MELCRKKVIRSRDIVFMEEKTIVDWEIENKSPTTKSSRVDAQPNREEVNSIKIESEPVNRFNTRQNREPAKEHTESTEQGTESNSDEEVKEEPTMPNEGRRYPLRERRAPRRFPNEENVLLTDEGQPESFEEAKNDTHNQKWLSAVQEEMDSLYENHTYELIELLRGKKALQNKWVFKLKPGDGGNPLRYKAQIVVKYFSAEERCGFRRDICPGREDGVNPYSAEHSEHGSRSRATRRIDCLPSRRLGGGDLYASTIMIRGER